MSLLASAGRTHLRKAVPYLLFFLALGIRLAFVLYYRFDGLYGQDAFTYYDQAVGIAAALPRGDLPPLDFFWPNGYPLIAAVFIWILGESEWALLLPPLLSGAALSTLAYLIGENLWGQKDCAFAGLFSGLAIAVAGQPILSSVTSMADILGLFWAMLAVWQLIRVWEPGKMDQKRLLLAGLYLALAAVTRWLYAVVALPFAVYALYQTREKSTPLRPLAAPALAGGVVLFVQIWLSMHRPEGLFHPWLVAWQPGNIFRASFQTADGLLAFERPVGLFYLLPAIHPAYLFVFGLAIPLGLLALWRAKDWGTLVLLCGWPMLVYLFLAGIPYENFRFGLNLYAPLVLLAGRGLAWLRPGLAKPKSLRMGFLVGVAAGLLFMLVWASRMVGPFIETQQAAKMQVLEIAAGLPENATVVTMGPTLIFRHYTSIRSAEFFSLDTNGLADIVTSDRPVYLLLDVPEIETRWQGMQPHENYRWLLENVLLSKLYEASPYTLFLIESTQ